MTWSNDYIRIPFAERGRSREGVDCWGLVRLVYEDKLGLTLPTLIGYQTTKDKLLIPHIIGTESARWEAVPIGEELDYDVAVFKMCGVAMHVGIVIKPGVMLHSERGSGTCVSNYRSEAQWSKRLEGFYRYAKRSD